MLQGGVHHCRMCRSPVCPDCDYVRCDSCGAFLCPACVSDSEHMLSIPCPECNVPLLLATPIDQTRISQNVLSDLASARVIQRDLVYIVGIPIKYAKDEILLSYEFFGQYGEVKKLVINTQSIHGINNQTPSVGAYITFKRSLDAAECINALESFVLDGSTMKASFGTTKYCSSFLRGQQCINPDCLYLHHAGNPEDVFSKAEISGLSPRFTEMTRPPRPLDYLNYPRADNRPTVLPPKRIWPSKWNHQNNSIGKQLVELLDNPSLVFGVPIDTNPKRSLREFLGGGEFIES